jgi:hypothetical protein
MCLHVKFEIFNFEIVFPEIFRLRQQVNPIAPFPPKGEE